MADDVIRLNLVLNESTVQTVENRVRNVVSRLNNQVISLNINGTNLDNIISKLNVIYRTMGTINNTSVNINANLTQAQQQYRLETERLRVSQQLEISRQRTLQTENQALTALAQQNRTLNINNNVTHQIEQGVQGIGNNMQTVGENTNDFVSYLSNGVRYLIVYRSLFSIMNQISESFGEMKNVDTALVDVRKTTGMSEEEIEKIRKVSYGVATEYGRVASEYLESVSEFARGGYEELSTELGKVSLLTQNVGDVSADSANKMLLAVDAAYQLEGNVEKLTSVVNGLNNIANKNPTSMQKMADGLQVSASMAKTAGMDISELTALIGTGTAVTQREGAEVARAIRTIVMNVKSVKGELEDGTIIDDESIAKAEAALKGVGISTKEVVNGVRELRNPMEVLDELADKWHTLGTEAKSVLTESIANKRQANVLSGILDNWSMVEKMQTEYFDSANSAIKENELYLDSWEAKSAQVSAKWTEYISNIADTSLIKHSLDTLYDAIVILDTPIGRLTTQIVLVNTALAVSNRLWGAIRARSIVADILAMGVAERSLGTAIQLVTGHLGRQALAWASSPIGMATITAVAIAGVVKAVDILGVTVEEQREELESLKQEYNEITSELRTLNSELSTTEERMKELESIESPTFAEKEEYDNLVKTNNELQRKIDLLELEERVKSQDSRKAFVSTMQKDTDGIKDKSDKYFYYVDPSDPNQQKSLGKGSTVTYSIGGFSIQAVPEDELIDVYENYANKLKELDEQYANDLENKTYKETKATIEQEMEDLAKFLADKSNQWSSDANGIKYISNPTSEDDKAVNEWLDYIADFQDRMAITMGGDNAKINTFNRIVDNWKFDDIVQGLQELGTQGQVTADMLADPKYDEFIAKLVELGVIDSADNLEDIALAFNKVVETTSSEHEYFHFDQSAFNEEIKSYEDGYSKLISAQEEWNESKAISPSTFVDLEESGLLEYIQFTSEGLEVNTEKLLENAQSTKDKAVADLHAAMTSDLLAIAMGNTESISAEAQSVIAQLGENTEVAGNQAMSSVSQWATLGDTISQVMADIKGEGYVSGISEEQKKQMSSVYDFYKNLATDISNIDITLGGSGSGGGSGSKSKSDFKETVDFFERRIDILNDAISRLKSNLENVTGSFAKNNLIDAQSTIYQEELRNYTDALDMYQKKANEVLATLPDDIAEKVKNGAIDLTTFVGASSEAVVDAINEYEQWAEKVDDCNLQLIELQKTLSDLELEKFNNVVSDFSSQFDLRDNVVTNIDKHIALLEEQGQLIGASFYDAQIQQSQKQLALLEQEKIQLVEQMNSALASGNVKTGSEVWLEMVGVLSDVEGQITDCKKSIEEFSNEILELNWKSFERVQDTFSDLNTELENFVGLLDDIDVADDKGNWSTEAKTKLGLLSQQYELAVYQVGEYRSAIEELKKQYANGDYSAIEFSEKLAELSDGMWDATNSANDLRDVIVDLNEQRVEVQIEGIEKEISAYEELIQKQIESIEVADKLKKKKDDLAEKSETLSDYEKQYAAVLHDNSASGLALQAKLKDQIEKAKKDLADAEYDYSVESQKESLEKQLEEYTNERNAEIEALEKSLENKEQLIADSFNVVKQNANLIGQQIAQIATEHGVIVSDSLISSWAQGENAIASYGTVLSSQSSAFIGNVMDVESKVWDLQSQANNTSTSLAGMFSTQADNLVSELSQSYYAEGNVLNMTNALHDSLVNTLESGYDASSITSALKSIEDSARGAADEIRKLGDLDVSVDDSNNNLSDSYRVYDVKYGRVIKDGFSSQVEAQQWINTNAPNTKEHYFVGKAYASGVHNLKKDELAWTQDGGGEIIVSPSRDAILTPLKRGDTVLTKAQTDNIFEWSKLHPIDMIPWSVRNSMQNVVNNFPQVATRNVNNTPSLHLDKLIHIDKVDSTNIKQMESIANKACDRLVNKLYDGKVYGSY